MAIVLNGWQNLQAPQPKSITKKHYFIPRLTQLIRLRIFSETPQKHPLHQQLSTKCTGGKPTLSPLLSYTALLIPQQERVRVLHSTSEKTTPQVPHYGNYGMVGQYDTTLHCFKDTLYFITENANPQIWAKTKLEIYSNLDFGNSDKFIALDTTDVNMGWYKNSSNQGKFNVNKAEIGFAHIIGNRGGGMSIRDTGMAIIYNTSPIITADSGATHVKIYPKLYASDIQMSGDLKYDFTHAIGSADSIAWATGSTQNVFYKINTGSFVWHEADDITGAGDSAIIQKAGDYKVSIWLGVTTTNANDMLQVKIFTNGVKSGTSLGRFFCPSMGTGIYPTRNFMWYKTFAAGDKISIRISNTSAARAMTISDFKLYIEKVPE